MAKWYGKIGYVATMETEPGIWEEVATEKEYYGELNRNNRALQNSNNINDDVSLSNEISIVADPFANQNFYSMRYVTFNGIKWKVTKVDVEYPRLILTVGGIYNG